MIKDSITDLLVDYSNNFSFSLQRMKFILKILGNPHLKIPPAIHIAGTNGKGSATAIIRSILEKSGYIVHVYTSPHLIHWKERYRLGCKNGGKYIKESELRYILEYIIRINNDKLISIFELLTLAAFLIFSEYKADLSIIEVGLGGVLDPTNVIENKIISLIMQIGIDHQNILGKNIYQITLAKAGIIKENIPVVISYQKDNKVIELLKMYAKIKNSPISIYGKNYFSYENKKYMIFYNQKTILKLPLPSVYGNFQIKNTIAAIETIFAAKLSVNTNSIKNGIKHIFWPGRLQKIKKGKIINLLPVGMEIWIDGGHNQSAANVISYEMNNICKRKKLILIFNMIKNKNYKKYLIEFLYITEYLYIVPINFNKYNIPEKDLEKFAKNIGFRTSIKKSIEYAIEEIIYKYKNKLIVILICGSLYLVGEFLKKNYYYK